MRKRGRNFPQFIYSYAAWFPGDERETAKELPQPLLNVVTEMQKLWNEYAVEFQSVLERTKESDKEQRIAALKEFVKWQSEIRNKYTNIPPDCRSAVFDRFTVSMMKYFKNLKAIKDRTNSGKFKEIKPPQVRDLSKIERFSVVFCSRAGGFKPSEIFSEKFRTFVEEVPEEAFFLSSRKRRLATVTKGHFILKSTETMDGKRTDTLNEKIPLIVHLSRPFPEGCFIKRITLVGELIKPFGWKMKLQFLLEVPHESIEKFPNTGRSCAIDVGWRHMGDYMRVGVVADSDGNVFELRLPDDFTPASLKRIIERNKNDGESHYGFTLVDIRKMQMVRDKIVDQVRESIDLSSIPERFRPEESEWRKYRNAKLIELLSFLESYDSADQVEIDRLSLVICKLRNFRELYNFWSGRIRNAQLRMMNSRDETYKRIGVWLVRNYDTLIWEGDLNLKEMAEDDNKNYALVQAAKYRQFCSLHIFRDKIKSVTRKRGKAILDHKTKGTSRKCHRAGCGAEIEPRAKLIVECRNGHREDQDINSALLMLQASTSEKVGGKIDIPEILRRNIVKIQ